MNVTVLVVAGVLAPVGVSVSLAESLWYVARRCLPVVLSVILSVLLAPVNAYVVLASETVFVVFFGLVFFGLGFFFGVLAVTAVILCPVKCSSALSFSVPRHV